MKSFLVLTLILGSQLVQAGPMDDQIRSLARRVTNNSQMAERLSPDEKVQVLKALNNADVILARVGTDYGGNGPGRDPWPNPYPSYPPYPSQQVTCDRDDNSAFQAAFIKVKNAAYSSSGLNYDSVSATAFAQSWASKNPCSYADLYVKNLLRLNTFAYSSSGLNYGSADARKFAIDNADNLCSGYNLEQEYSSAYNFAYSSNGMNMNSVDARNYAIARIRSSAFTCRNN